MNLITLRDGNFVLVNTELYLIKEIRDLLDNDTSPRKDLHIQEIGMLYWLEHPCSPGIISGKSGKELFNDGKKNLDLPLGWQVTPQFELARLWYKNELDKVIAYKVCRNIIKALTLSNDVLEKLLEQFNKVKLSASADIDAKIVLSNVNAVINTSNEIPSQIIKLKKLYSTILQIEREIKNRVGKGGKVIPISADPSTSVIDGLGTESYE